MVCVRGSAAGCEPALASETGTSHVPLRVGGADRAFLLFVPSGYDGSQPQGLLLVFHGAGPAVDDRPRSQLEFDEIWSEPLVTLPGDLVIAAPPGSWWRLGRRWP